MNHVEDVNLDVTIKLHKTDRGSDCKVAASVCLRNASLSLHRIEELKVTYFAEGNVYLKLYGEKL